MFERFTEKSRQVVIVAQDEARVLKHAYIGTEHLLLGLILTDGLASRILATFALPASHVRTRIRQIVGEGEGFEVGQIPFTPRAKKVLELALREALSLGHNYIGTEHILLGLVRENEGVAARILQEADLTPEKVRSEVIRNLSRVKSEPPRKQLSTEQLKELESDLFTVCVEATTLSEAETAAKAIFDDFFSNKSYEIVHVGGVWDGKRGLARHDHDRWVVYVEAVAR